MPKQRETTEMQYKGISSDLILINGDANNIRSRPSSNSTHRTANAAPNIKDAVSGANFQKVDSHLLMDTSRILMRFSRNRRSKMEALPPTPFIDVRDEVVEGINEMGYFVSSLDLFGSKEEGPVLLVFVLHLLARDGAAAEVDGALPLLLGRAQDADEPVEGECKQSCCKEESKRIHGEKRETKSKSE